MRGNVRMVLMNADSIRFVHWCQPHRLASAAATLAIGSSVVLSCQLRHFLYPSHTDRAISRAVIKPAVSAVARGHPMKQLSCQFLAGAAGGGCATYATHWLDTVKVRMQTAPDAHMGGGACTRELWARGGLRALYQGATPALVGQVAKASVVFASYGACEQLVRRAVGSNTNELSVSQRACAGGMTGIVASFVLCPMEVIKCNMQAQNSSAGAGSVLRSVVRGGGVAGLYRGLTSLWAKEVPGSFLYFGSFEAAKDGLSWARGGKPIDSKIDIFGCGVVAGLAFCSMHPVESIKTRVQITPPSSECHGFFRTGVHVLKTEGFRPLWSGLQPSMLRACLFSGVQFMIYQTVKDMLLNKKQQKP